MNTDQLIPILKTLKTQAAAGAWEQALSLLEPVQATPAKDVVVETPDAPVKAKEKRVMSEEQKAKMKAGREAAKAKKDAEKEASAKRHLKFDDDEAPAPAEPVAPAPPVEKPKRVLSEEQKAKMKAGREAAKAKKAAAAAPSVEAATLLAGGPVSGADIGKVDIATVVAAVAPAKAKRVLSEEQKAKMKAGREAAKAKKAAASAPAPAPPAEPPAPEVLRCAECHKAVGDFDHRHCFFRGKGGVGYESAKEWEEAARAYTATLTA